MGCCSGRCTLAFICGMQLVSLKVAIVSIRGCLSGQISQEKDKLLLFFSSGKSSDKVRKKTRSR